MKAQQIPVSHCVTASLALSSFSQTKPVRSRQRRQTPAKAVAYTNGISFPTSDPKSTKVTGQKQTEQGETCIVRISEREKEAQREEISFLGAAPTTPLSASSPVPIGCGSAQETAAIPIPFLPPPPHPSPPAVRSSCLSSPSSSSPRPALSPPSWTQAVRAQGGVRRCPGRPWRERKPRCAAPTDNASAGARSSVETEVAASPPPRLPLSRRTPTEAPSVTLAPAADTYTIGRRSPTDAKATSFRRPWTSSPTGRNYRASPCGSTGRRVSSPSAEPRSSSRCKFELGQCRSLWGTKALLLRRLQWPPETQWTSGRRSYCGRKTAGWSGRRRRNAGRGSSYRVRRGTRRGLAPGASRARDSTTPLRPRASSFGCIQPKQWRRRR